MRKKIISLLMLFLILMGTLTVAFNIKPSFAESCEDSGFERKPVSEERAPLERPSKTSRDEGDKWNFNDTSGWSKFAYANGNKTRLIVGINGQKPTSVLELEKIAAKHQAEIVSTVSIKGEVKAVVVELSLASVMAFVEEIRVVELATYMEPNMKVQAQFVPNDPYWGAQWGPQKIEADWAWNTTKGSSSVLVAVVDTGICYTHSDLAANYAPSGYDWVNNDTDPIDDHGHGTHCAGIIAAVLNNSIGIAGLAQVRVMTEKVLSSGGWGYWDWVANGITHAVDQGANIISMSLGGYGDSELVHEAVRYAYESGVLVIAAAGNENTATKSYPAAYDEVVAVAATDSYDDKAAFSNWGDWIELAAPGVSIYSTVPWGYESWSGTSMACPHVSGLAALAWSRYPNKARDWVRLWLRYTADDLGDPGFDIYYGYGRINARKAVEQVPPAHELIAYGWSTPPYLEPGAIGKINTTLLNFGEENESNIMVRLLANGTVVDSASIEYLASGNSTRVNLVWNPSVEGLYNVTLCVEPVPDEINLKNNVFWKNIHVGFPLKAVVLHSAGNILGEIVTNWQVLNDEWHLLGSTMIYIDYTTLNKENISYEDIVASEADVLIISCAYDPYAGWQFTESEIEVIERYVHEGHGLIVTAGTFYYGVPNNNKLAPLFGLNETTMWDVTATYVLELLDTTHPIFAKIPNPLLLPQVLTTIPFDGMWDSNELAGGEYLALGADQESAIVAYRGLVYISPWLEVIPPYYYYHLQLLYNAITWSRYQKPEHELVVSLETPLYLQPGESALLNATVYNMGLNNEADVELYLLISGTIVNSTTIPELPAGASYTIEHFWASSVEKIYNVTAYSPPLLSEEYPSNNFDSVFVCVHLVRSVLWDDTKDADGDSLTGNYLSLYQLLTSSGFIVDELTIGPINSELLAKYDILVLMDPELDFLPSEIADIKDWVESGGALIVIPDGGWPWTINTLLAPYGVQMSGRFGGYGTTTDIVSHPITQWVKEIYVNWVQDILVKSPSTCLAWVTEYSERYAFLSAAESGEVVVLSDSNIMDNNGLGMADNMQLMLSIFNWLIIKPEHDLDVTLESPAFLEPDTSVLLNATIHNRGTSNESDVELQLWINTTIVVNVTISELPTRTSRTFSYLWTPTVEGVYNITAYAPPVPNEEYVANNLKYCSVLVSVFPDILIVSDDDALSGIRGTCLREFGAVLTAEGYEYWVWNESALGNPALEFMTIFKLVIWTCGDNYNMAIDLQDALALEDYFNQGGNILLEGEDIGYNHRTDSLMTNVAHALYQVDSTGAPGLTVTDPTHPVTQNLPTTFTWDIRPPYDDGVIPTNNGSEVIRYTETLWTAVTVFDKTGTSFGSVVYYAFPVYSLAESERSTLIINSVCWLLQIERDVAIISVEPSASEVVCGDFVNVTVIAENHGKFTETFTVKAHASLQGKTLGAAYISSSSTRIYLDPSNYTFSTGEVSIGYRFNVTVKVADVKDLAVWQVGIYYNDKMIRSTRWFEPTWDSEYVFYGETTVKAGFQGKGFIWAGATLLPSPPKQPSFNGSGKLCIIEFEIRDVPPEGETYSCPLNINNRDTFLLDSHVLDIPAIKENGYYELRSILPPGRYTIGTLIVRGLASGERVTLIFTWNTTNVLPGDYVIYARASNVPGETDTEDNVGYDGIITVKLVVVHDVAVTNVVVPSNIAYQKWIVGINVTVANFGNTAETFTLRLYYNSSVIALHVVQDLQPNATLTLRFDWNTTNVQCRHNYTIKACADAVPGETRIANNEFVYGEINVRLMGDIDDNGGIDMRDVGIACRAFGSFPGDLEWSFEVDLDQNGLVDLRDIAMVLVNFGKTC